MNDELHLSASGANGIGQRTALTDPSGSTQWNYNARGLTITATKTICGAGSFTTRNYYDAQERVITTTYPTGEVITHTYNAQGLLENVRSQTHNQWVA